MHLNRLCYILPADSDIGDEISDKKNPAGALHLNRLTYVLPAKSEHRQEKSSRNCNDQIVALLNRIVKPLNFCSGIRKKRGKPGRFSGAFHDAPGMRLSRRNNGDNNHANNNSPRIFSYAELYIGSNGFSQKELLGSGGFGRVYKAALPSDGSLVAVKCLAEKGEHFEKTFAAELVAVAHLRHRNLVRLRGWCVHEDQLLLVYDYMPNRSLDRLIFAPSTTNQKNRDTTLDWERRKKIIRGLAAALYYLHEQLDTQIIHRDVKSSNVMLDSHFNARLGDFGLARWLEHDFSSNLNPNSDHTPNGFERVSSQSSLTSNSTSVLDHQFRLAETTRIGGTIGYLPPESFQRKYIATAKSDVFSFGIVALELASGRRAVDLAYPDDHIVLLDSVRRSADEGSLLQAADSRLLDGSYSLSEMEILIHLGLLCTLHDPKSRPNMRWIVEMLSGNVIGKLPSLPSFKSQPRYISISGSSTSRSKITTSSSDEAPTPSIFITAAVDTLFLTAEPESTTTEKSGGMKGSSTGSRRHQFNPFPTVETPREISYNEIVVATNNFSDEHRVAEVDFGTAYHGTLENRHHVIVKRLTMKTCPALRARFSTELQNIGRLRHRNLVQLRGWCTEHGEMLVVYDYMATRLLSHILFHNKVTCLKWRQRYNIVKSLASAILYLHEEWDEQVIHRHITSASIALDLDTNPRLTSFALAEFLTRNEHGHHIEKDTTKSVRGIFGYMSPEYMESGEANTAADIYSFGVVVVEVVTGQMAVDFRRPEVLLVKRLHEFESKKREMEELVDQRLDGEYDRFEFNRLVKLGLACTRSKPEERPSIRQIMSILDGNDSGFIQGKKEKGDEWRQRNAAALALTRRIQALGIQ